MLKSELVKRIAAKNPNLRPRDVKKIVNAMFGEIIAALVRRDRIEVHGFGVFSIRVRRARFGRNPRTGARISVKKKSVPFFSTRKEMRARLNPVAGLTGDERNDGAPT